MTKMWVKDRELKIVDRLRDRSSTAFSIRTVFLSRINHWELSCSNFRCIINRVGILSARELNPEARRIEWVL